MDSLKVDGDRFELSGEALEAWCRRAGSTYRTEGGTLAIDYVLLGQPSPLMVLPHLDRGMVMFVMRQPFRVGPDRLASVTTAIAAMNAMSFMGAWVVNPDNGELYFRATVPVAGIRYTDEGLLTVARVVVGTSELAAPALRAIVLEGADPTVAIATLKPS